MGISDFLKKGITVKEATATRDTPKRLRSFDPKVDGYRKDNSTQRVEMYYPKNIEDAKKLVDFIATGEAVLVDLSRAVDESEAQSMLDFFCGAAYALSGKATEVGDNIFLITMPNVEVLVEER